MARLQILHQVTRSKEYSKRAKQHEKRGYSLLCTSLGDSAGDDICDDVPWLYPCKEQLTDLAEAADRVQVRLSQGAHADDAQ